MLRSSFATSCVLSLFAALPAQDRGNRGDDPKLGNFTIEKGTLTSSRVREGEAGFTVFLPKGYADDANQNTKYPLALWLPGFGGTDEFERRGGAEVLDQLAGEGKLPPLVLAVFRAPGRRGRSTYMNGEAGGDIEDLIVKDLVAQLEAKYRLLPDKKARALMGVSAGGFGALKLALRHPDVFGVVAAHSAAILPADPADLGGTNESIVQRQLRAGLSKELGDPIDPAKWAAHMPLGIVATKKPEELSGLHIYFDAGTDDDYGFCEPNEKLDQVMKERGFKHTFRKVEGGGHAFSSPSMKDNVAVSLQFLGAAFAGKDPAAAVAALTTKGEAKADAPGKGEPKKDGGK